MALTENPKLALLPSGYKASKVYSVLPSDGVGDFDFSRSGEATRINKDGLIETVASNVPRLNYPLIDGVVSGCPSLLLENSATNLVQYSEDFSNVIWTKEGTSITPNTVISPDGTLNADKLVESATTSQHRIYSVTVTTSATLYTSSVFAKAGERGWISIEAVQGGGRVWFDLTNGVVGSNTASSIGTIKQYPNGWYKCSNTWTDTGGGGNRSFINVCSGDSIISYTGDGTSGVYIYGAQLEQSSFPTSYIPSLTGSQTTRSAETCNNAGDVNTFNDSEGVLMAEISALDNLVDGDWISINDGGINNRILIGYSGANAIRFILISGSVFQVDFSKTIASRISFNKVAFKWGLNDCSFWINGIRVDTDISATMPVGLVQLSFNDGATANFKGSTKQLQYFDTALTDTDLEELTSWTSFNEMAESQQYSVY